MILFFFLLVLGLFFVFLFYFLNFLLSFKLVGFFGGGSFESGFDSIGKIQNSFSLHFFFIMLFFIIFDVEIVLLLGTVVGGGFFFFSFLLLFFFIVFGLYLEWFFNKLCWVI